MLICQPGSLLFASLWEVLICQPGSLLLAYENYWFASLGLSCGHMGNIGLSACVFVVGIIWEVLVCQSRSLSSGYRRY